MSLYTLNMSMSIMNYLVSILFLLCVDGMVFINANPAQDKSFGSTKTYLSHHPAQPSATLVTALYDIGRGGWKKWQRSLASYLDYFTNILKLGTKVLIYCEKSTADTLQAMYRDLLYDNVYIVVQSFHEIEFEQYRQIVKHIMKSDDFLKDNKNLLNPEGFSVDYILLMSNKLSFMTDAIRRNTCDCTHFFWIDAGYGHGESNIFSNHSEWAPSKLLTLNKTVTFTKLNDPSMYKDIWTLHKQNVNPAISGGFFGGHRKAVTEFYHLYNKEFRRMLLENVVDDDQTISLACYYELPRLFNLIDGDWFDAFKLYGK